MRPGGSGIRRRTESAPDGLAGTAFADDRHGFARLDGIGDAVNGAHDSSTGSEFGVQVLHFQEWQQDPSPTQPCRLALC